jgi:hypothetical protein
MTQSSLVRRKALRALAEGAKPTLGLLADASGLSVRTISAEAARDNWAIGRGADQDIGARLRTLAATLLDRMEAWRIAAMEEGGRIDKQEIESMLSLIRGVEKIEEIMRPEEAAKKSQIRTDEDLADTLDRINKRIVELAKEIAADMVAEAGRARSGATGPG